MNTLPTTSSARSARVFAGAAVAIALCTFATDGNAEYATRYLGGIGGGSYRSPCRPNDVLVGVHVRSGNAVDAITAICTPLNPARTDWAGETYQPTQAWGGGGGGPKTLRCQPGDAVHRLKVQQGPWDIVTVVKGISLLCGDLDAAHFYEVAQGAQSTVSGSGEVKCNDGDWATGIFGNSGALVDSVGLLCDHIAPASVTTPPSRETTPAAPQRPIKPMSPAKTREECDARGDLWIAQKERCIGKALLTALRTVCEKKGADYRFDPQTAECIGPQQGGGQTVCTVKKTGTVYDRPGGDEIGELAAPTAGVTLIEKEGTDWYHVKWPAGEGWVYSGPGYRDAIACP